MELNPLLSKGEITNDLHELTEVDYTSNDYWNKRYAADLTSFDWLMNYRHIIKSAALKCFITQTDRILILGCGNADFSSALYDDGYTNLVNIDLSEVVIESMGESNRHRTNMQYFVMDVTSLSFPSASFDVVLDKSTMDCIFCCDNSDKMIFQMLQEGYRVLKAGGLYLLLSLHDSTKVMPYIIKSKLNWLITHYPVLNPRYNPNEECGVEFHHFFILRKK